MAEVDLGMMLLKENIGYLNRTVLLTLYWCKFSQRSKIFFLMHLSE